MTKIKLGIPRSFLYHRYGVMWRHFFSYINCKIILSPETNKEILSLGMNNTTSESCLSYIIHIGHIVYLSEKCDYILIPKILDNNKTCHQINYTYENTRYLIPKLQILTYNINNRCEIFEFIKMGLKFNKNIIRIICSYYLAKKKQHNYDINRINETKNKLSKSNKKIFLFSHYYNLKDEYITGYIKQYLRKNDIIYIYSNDIDKKTAMKFSLYFPKKIPWLYSKEMIGSFYYYKNMIDGVIAISTHPCDFVNTLELDKNSSIPILNLIIDENINNIKLETQLESFIDIIKETNNK